MHIFSLQKWLVQSSSIVHFLCEASSPAGKVVEFGPPKELLQSDGAFSSLVSSSGDRSGAGLVEDEGEKTFFSL